MGSILDINLDGIPLWLIIVVFFSVVIFATAVTVVVCVCERRRRIRRAVMYVEDTQADSIECMLSRATPRMLEEDEPSEEEPLVVTL